MPILFILSQALYLFSFLVDLYLESLPVDWVDPKERIAEPESEWPYIVLFYPVLRELEATMRTTFLSLANLDYPADRCRVIAIPNSNDQQTVASLRRLVNEFAFLEILEVPPTSDSTWQVVWDSWDANQKAYWWHRGKRAGVRDLPPKKTRQLIYALYRTAQTLERERNLVINYIDADSCPPTDHFKAAVIGLRHYDVLQAENVAGNLNASMAATSAVSRIGCWAKASSTAFPTSSSWVASTPGSRSKIPRSGCAIGQMGNALASLQTL
ncbi:MAG: hypothetical protein ABSF08_11275 [Candidatus Cybelea sp.]